VSKKSSASLSVALHPSQSLNWNNPKQPCSIRLLLYTPLGGSRGGKKLSDNRIIGHNNPKRAWSKDQKLQGGKMWLR